MASSLLRRAWLPLLRRSWKPLAFPKDGIQWIPRGQKVEEETNPDYMAIRYFPVQIGDTLKDRYQIVGKLGFGTTSTIWLARDLDQCRHVALKIYIRSASLQNKSSPELGVYKCIEKSSRSHPGRQAVRALLDEFTLDGPDGQHQCLVHEALWDSIRGLRYRNPVAKLPTVIVATMLRRVFQALTLLHEECRVAHTDLKEDNILIGADASMLKEFEDAELRQPSARKEVDGRVVYLSREIGMPKDAGIPVLCDFGSCVPLDDGIEHREDIQPDIYRAPEVIIDVPWTYSVDIWNVGCVVWDALQGEHLFTGIDPETGKYRGRAHIAEIIALLGPPPQDLLARADLRRKFFSEHGEFSAGIRLPASEPLEQRETSLLAQGDAEDRAYFLRFMRRMLQWEPEKRSTARELAEDEWIIKNST